MSRKSNRHSVILWLPIAFSVVAMLLLMAALAFDWMGESGVAALQYCEAIRDRLIRQPSNAWSNLGFIFVGWLTALNFRKDHQIGSDSLFNRTAFYPVFFSFMAVFLGVGSFAYHASATHLGGYLDIGSMYLLSSFMFAYALKRLFYLKAAVFAIIFFAGLLVSAYFLFQTYMYPGEIDSASFGFGLFLVIATGVEAFLIYQRKISINGKWALGFSVTFIISVFIWSRSRTGGVWCDPSSLFQGHAVWHLLDALCVYFIYRYYKSEKIS